MHIEDVRLDLCARLRDRRAELTETALTRVVGVSDPREAPDPQYAEGLRTAVATALEYGIETLESSEDHAPPVPTALLSQARMAARNRVPLATVLRRYFAGYTLFSDFVIEEAERAGISDGAALKRLMRVQSALFDNLVAVVTEEYNREATPPRSRTERRTRRVERLLAGERLDPADLSYDLERWHVGLALFGREAEELVRHLSVRVDARVLAVPREEGVIWAWLGSRRRFGADEVLAAATPELTAKISLAVGEPGEGVAGWRLTHRQASAALSVALRTGEEKVRYSDVALLASIMQDDLLAVSLRRLYVKPLERERNGGEAVRETLRTYFASGRNVSSTAAAMGVARQTVTKRLRVAEDRVGHPLGTHGTEMEIALRLQEMASRSDPGSPGDND